MIELTATVCR